VQRTLAVDLVVLAVVLVGLGVPLRFVSGLGQARAFGVVAYCWMPLFLLHALGNATRLGLDRPPASFPWAEEWLAGLAGAAGLAVVAFRTALARPPAPPASAPEGDAP
jgi:hypothetical protein